MKISSLATVALALAAAAPTAARRQTRATKPTRSLEDVDHTALDEEDLTALDEDKKGDDIKKICEASTFEGTFQYSSPTSGLMYTVIVSCQDDEDYGKKCQGVQQSDGDPCAYYAFFTEDDVVYDKDKKMCGLGPTRTGDGTISWPIWFDPLKEKMPGSVNDDANPWYQPTYVATVVSAGGGYIPSITNAACTLKGGKSGALGLKYYMSDSGNQIEGYLTANAGLSFTAFGPAGAEVPRFARRVGPA